MPAENQVASNILEVMAKEIAGEIAAGQDLRGIDPISIMTVIVTIFQTIIQSCPKPAAAIAEDIRRPNILQKAALRKKAHDMADDVNSAKAIFRQMLIKSSQLTQVDAMALVTSALNDTNMLI